jgi:hypothetical protein
MVRHELERRERGSAGLNVSPADIWHQIGLFLRIRSASLAYGTGALKRAIERRAGIDG